MYYVRRALFVLLSVCIGSLWGQSKSIDPKIGFLYPAGGQRGTTFQIAAGGQFLRKPTDVYISGKGVHAKVIKYITGLMKGLH